MPSRIEEFGIQHRSASISGLREVTTKRGTTQEFDLSISSEYPVERWIGGDYGMEVLSHEPGAVRLGRLNSGGAFLVNHNDERQVGAFVAGSAAIGEDRKLRGTVRFSRASAAKEIADDIADDIRVNTSVGYRVHRYERAPDLETLDKDGQPKIAFWRATDWEPIEASIVPAGADPTVGKDRAVEQKYRCELVGPEPQMPADPPPPAPTQEPIIAIKEGKQMPEPITPTAPAVDIEKLKSEGADGERKRQAIIREIGKKFSVKDEVIQKFINDGTPADAVRDHVMANWSQDMVNTVNPRLDLTTKEVKRYSILKAMRAMVTDDWSDAGFERECSVAQRKKARDIGIPDFQERGFAVPLDIPMPAQSLRDVNGRVDRERLSQFVRANLTAGVGGTEGSEFIQTDLLANEFIDVLRNRAFVLKAGARVLSGAVGNIAIPRQTAAIAPAISATEVTAFTEGAPTYDQVTLSPKIVNSKQPISQLLLQQSSKDFEALVRDDMIAGVAVKMDVMALYGSAASGEPRGIFNVSGIGSTDHSEADATWAKIVDPETQVAIGNADVDGMAWMVNAKTRGKWKGLVQQSGQPVYLWDVRDPARPLNGYPAFVTNQCTSNTGTGSAFSTGFFGNWPECLIPLWGGLYILMDPYTLADTNLIRILCRQFFDIGVRHPASFCKVIGIKTT